MDSIMAISVYLSNLEETVPLFYSLFALFERTFSDATTLHWWIDNEVEAFMPSVNNLRDFVNLEKLVVRKDCLVKLLFPFLTTREFSLTSHNKFLHFNSVTFQDGDTIHRVADFLQWRREQGFPVEKIVIFGGKVNRKYVLTYIQDTIVEMDGSDTEEEDNN